MSAHNTHERAQRITPGFGDVGGHAAGHDLVAHQAVTEAGISDAQNALAQHGAMGLHHREGRVVADRADIAQVIGEPFQFRHQAAQPVRAARRLDAESRLGGAGEGQLVGDGAVAGGPARELRGALQIGPGQQ